MKLEPYFARIGFHGNPRPDLDTLKQLHLLHPCAIPFENLSTLLGEPVLLETAALEEKLILGQRGGYCFEQNTLFQQVLEAIGFDLTPLAARVVWNQDKGPPNPRTHMALLVETGGNQFLCDVGFGGATLTGPLAFEPGMLQTTPHEPYQIEAIGSEFTLKVRFGDTWRYAYEFDLQPQRPIDYEAMNHYVQTHPGSHFRSVLMVGRPDTAGRLALGGNELTRYQEGLVIERRQVDSAAELASLLTNEFQIGLPDHHDLDSLLERVADTSPQ